MRVNLLDPGLVHTSGHHLDWDIKVIDELIVLGHRVSVYSHSRISPEAARAISSRAQLVPRFRAGPYLETPDGDPLAGEMDFFLEGAARLAEDLKLVGESDLWIWPSLFAPQLLACSMAAPAAAVSGCIHVEPAFLAPNGRMWWHYAFVKASRANLRLRVGVTGPALQREYSTLTVAGRIDRFPSVYDAVACGGPKTELKKIGFFGCQRPEKGAHLLPAVVPRLLHDGYQVVLHDSGTMVRADHLHGLTILGFVPSLTEEIARCDLVVAPYDPASYRFKESGIVWQALASGVPVVLPADTAPGQIVQQFGAGKTFASMSAADVYGAILDAKKDFPGIARRALAASTYCRETQGARRFVQALLGR